MFTLSFSLTTSCIVYWLLQKILYIRLSLQVISAISLLNTIISLTAYISVSNLALVNNVITIY